MFGQGCGRESSPSGVRRHFLAIHGSWVRLLQVERKHWDDKKTGVLIKLLAVPDKTGLVVTFEFT
jgi:hypothetical protein